MHTEKVRIVEKLHSSVTNLVEFNHTDNALVAIAQVTEQNGTVTSIDGIEVKDSDGNLLWSGYANPTIGGNMYQEGREIEVMMAVMDFINAIKSNN